MATPIPTNEAPFSPAELLQATGGKAVGTLLDVRGVVTDSRRVHPGCVFVALRGESHDAHAYVPAAFRAGAAVAVVERDDPEAGGPTLRVDSTLAALGNLARAHLRRWRAGTGGKIIAITGSAGKTTTKAATSALLTKHLPDQVIATVGNLNNQVGVPMTAFTVTHQHRIALFEIGTNFPGEIALLARMLEPDVGVVTLVAAAHTEGFGSLDGVLAEKTSLWQHLAGGGTAIVNADDARLTSAIASHSGAALRYGRAELSDVRILERQLVGIRSRVALQVKEQVTPLNFETSLLGEAGALACAGAVACAQAVGTSLTPDRVAAAFGGVDAGRLRLFEVSGGGRILDDAYNANPSSMVSSIGIAQELACERGERLILVLGEMRELGPLSESGHREVGTRASAAGAALIIVVGKAAVPLVDVLRKAGTEPKFVTTADEAADLLRSELRSGDLALIKGSHGIGLHRIPQLLGGCAPKVAQSVLP